MKRDDQTGLAFGGNKTRKLDFIMADVMRKKSDMIITFGGVQSNWCRLTAAAAKKCGVKPLVVLFREKNSKFGYDGNRFLMELLGADIRIFDRVEDRLEFVERIANEERTKGNSPYVVSVGGSETGGSMDIPFGAVSYVNAFVEMYGQAQQRDISIDTIIHPTASGSTQAGLIVGTKALNSRIRVIGISVDKRASEAENSALTIARQTIKALNLNVSVTPDDVIVLNDYYGNEHGDPNPEIYSAICKVARTEGILLDPQYTGKAMLGLLALSKIGYIRKSENVVFLHTGGTPLLFTYRNEIMDYLRKKS